MVERQNAHSGQSGADSTDKGTFPATLNVVEECMLSGTEVPGEWQPGSSSLCVEMHGLDRKKSIVSAPQEELYLYVQDPVDLTDDEEMLDDGLGRVPQHKPMHLI